MQSLLIRFCIQRHGSNFQITYPENSDAVQYGSRSQYLTSSFFNHVKVLSPYMPAFEKLTAHLRQNKPGARIMYFGEIFGGSVQTVNAVWYNDAVDFKAFDLFVAGEVSRRHTRNTLEISPSYADGCDAKGSGQQQQRHVQPGDTTMCCTSRTELTFDSFFSAFQPMNRDEMFSLFEQFGVPYLKPRARGKLAQLLEMDPAFESEVYASYGFAKPAAKNPAEGMVLSPVIPVTVIDDGTPVRIMLKHKNQT